MTPFNCSYSPTGCNADEETKLAMHCGYRDKEMWPPGPAALPKFIGDKHRDEYRVDLEGVNVCPGWMVRQRQVIESVQAYTALDKGALPQFYPENEAIAQEAALLVLRSYNAHQAYDLHKMREKK